jgi:hypothetical protein
MIRTNFRKTESRKPGKFLKTEREEIKGGIMNQPSQVTESPNRETTAIANAAI